MGKLIMYLGSEGSVWIILQRKAHDHWKEGPGDHSWVSGRARMLILVNLFFDQPIRGIFSAFCLLFHRTGINLMGNFLPRVLKVLPHSHFGSGELHLEKLGGGLDLHSLRGNAFNELLFGLGIWDLTLGWYLVYFDGWGCHSASSSIFSDFLPIELTL